MTTEKYNIIGDVAGQYKTLMRLLDKMPIGSKTILLGDLVDRGPRSRQVVQFARNNSERVISLLGNHEHMMVDFALMGPTRPPVYDDRIWIINGGGPTIKSYLPNAKAKEMTLGCIQDALYSDAKWMETLPLFFEAEGLFVSHAPVSYGFVPAVEKVDPYDFCWNRQRPCQRLDQFIVHGHNSGDKVRWYREPSPLDIGAELDWGVNIDTSQGKILTGFHWPTKEIFQQEYVD